jgi:hypothetical protein
MSWFRRPKKTDPTARDVLSLERMAELTARLEELSAKDTDFKVFGAESHRYQLNPRLSEDELNWFEAEYAVTLPADYRSFLTCVGNGGAGPNYGLLSLEQAVLQCGERSRAFLTASFPLTERFNPYTATEPLVGVDEDFPNDQYRRGSLTLSHQGCGNYDLLVISGPQRGQVWSDGRSSDHGFVPHRRSFYEWYNWWLLESIGRLWRKY